ncbi:hypothetical protein [Sphingomonas sp. MMS24-J13]|uniref:hypothetical protein n=1 Tax=Sphingomonas sp. MMS24-J13 TaxID=3238686 RepID=UPI003850EBA4
MGLNTAAGASIALSVAAPATQDAAGYAALTYTEVGSIEKIGGIGATFSKVEFNPLKGGKKKLKGQPDYGTLQPSIGIDETDAGQTLLLTAASDQTNKYYSFKVIKQNGAIRYFQGLVFGLPETIDGVDTVDMSTPTIEINTPIVRVAAP